VYSCPPSQAAEKPDFPDARTIRAGRRRTRRANLLGRTTRIRGARERRCELWWQRQQVLLPVDVPLSVRPSAHGPRAQLHDRRRADPLCEDAGQECAAAHGLGCVRPAGRKRRHQEWRAAGEMDARQHRVHEGAAEIAGLRVRLVARDRDLRSVLLPLEPVAVPAHAREGHRVSQDRRRELGSGGPDRARQRAGDRRARLAHRRNRREARNSNVLPRHHEVCRRVVRRSRETSRLARARQDDAGQLDRQVRRLRNLVPVLGQHAGADGRRRRAQGVHHARGHVVWRDIHGDRCRTSVGNGHRRAQSGAAGFYR